MTEAIPRAATCETCVFWQPAAPGERPELGECRIYPPATADARGGLAPWPLTRSNDWCAEHGSLDTLSDDTVTH